MHIRSLLFGKEAIRNRKSLYWFIRGDIDTNEKVYRMSKLYERDFSQLPGQRTANTLVARILYGRI